MLRTAAEHLINQLQLQFLRSTCPCAHAGLITRSYARLAHKQRPETTLKPLEVTTVKRKPFRLAEAQLKKTNIAPASVRKDLDEFDPTLEEEIANLDDDGLEPDLGTMSLQYDMYQEEKQALYLKTRRLAATRKHYKEFLQPEISLLTYAEKEKIKYLHSIGGWTVEMIADAFPITISGAEKLVRSKFKLRTAKEIMNHDQTLVQRLRRIESGEIDVDPELESSLAKRSSQTLFVGAKWNPDHFVDGKGGFDMSEKPKRPLGEFESLVVIPKKEKKTTTGEPTPETPDSSLVVASPADSSTTPEASDEKQRPESKPTSFEDELEGVRDIRTVYPNFDGGEDERQFKSKLSRQKPDKVYTLAEFERILKSNN